MLGDGLCPPALFKVVEASVGDCVAKGMAITEAVVVVDGGSAVRANRGSAKQGGWGMKNQVQ